MERSSKYKLGTASGLRLPRRASMIGVVLSTVYSIIAIAAAPIAVKPFHIHLAAYGGMLLFPHAVAIAYVASGTARGNKWLQTAALLIPIAAVTPLTAILYKRVADIITAITFSPMIPAAITAARARKASVRLSMYLVGFTYIVTLATAIAISIIQPLPSTAALAYTIAFDVTLIYAVTHHALPATFRDKPHANLAWIPHSLALVSVILLLMGKLRYATLLLWTSLTLYIYTAKIYKIKDYLKSISGLPEGPAKAGMRYFALGHIAVGLAIILIILSTLNIIIGKTTGHSAILELLHATTISFTLTHIAIHEPMMIPVILGLKHRREFYDITPVLFAVAGALWILLPPASLAIIVLGIVLMTYMTI